MASETTPTGSKPPVAASARFDVSQPLRLRASWELTPVAGALPEAQKQQLADLRDAIGRSPDEMLRDQERLRRFETHTLALRRDAVAARARAADLQARLAETEGMQYANPLVYSLAAFSTVMAAGWILQRRQALAAQAGAAESRPAWWAPAGQSAEPAHSAIGQSELEDEAFSSGFGNTELVEGSVEDAAQAQESAQDPAVADIPEAPQTPVAGEKPLPA